MFSEERVSFIIDKKCIFSVSERKSDLSQIVPKYNTDNDSYVYIQEPIVSKHSDDTYTEIEEVSRNTTAADQQKRSGGDEDSKLPTQSVCCTWKRLLILFIIVILVTTNIVTVVMVMAKKKSEKGQ